MHCYNCQTTIGLERKPGRNDTCPKCTFYLHTCRNCRFYEPAAHNQCREPQADWVKDKEMANFCDYFEAASEVTSGPSKKDEALKKLNDLFKKK